MKRSTLAGTAFVIVLVPLALVVGYRALERSLERRPDSSPPSIAASTPPSAAAPEDQPGFLYGRVTTDGGLAYEGRLRFGIGQEAFWGDYFNGRKKENLWAAQVPAELLPKERHRVEILGIEVINRQRPADLSRLVMARFGDIARIEAVGRDVQVTLKSGTVLVLDRFEASDFDDDLRVWDAKGVVDLDTLRVRAIEFLPAARVSDAPSRLHGTVRTRQGEFTGFVQWNRQDCVGTDELEGRTADGKLRLRFDTVRSIARRSARSSLVTLRDGREIELSGAHEVGDGNARGIYVDDPRYGRVLVSWDAFERLDFSLGESGAPSGSGTSGPAYGDFPPGRALLGSVTTRTGSRLAGRLVFDLDESETTETLDAPSGGVDYTIPFGLVASIVRPGGETGERNESPPDGASVTLHGGEKLELERGGDLGEKNAGMLIFVDGNERPEYVPWADVTQIDFVRPPAMYPPLGGGQVPLAETGAE